MADINWPSTVPLPGAGYSFDVQPRVMRGNRSKEINPSSSLPGKLTFIFSIQQVFSLIEFSAFKVWFEDTLLNGVLPFNTSLALGNTDLQTCEVRFLGSSFSANCDKVLNQSVSFKLVCFNPPILTEDEYDDLYVINEAGLLELFTAGDPLNDLVENFLPPLF